MKSNTFLASLRLATAALATAMLAPACANSPRTPIKHVIIVIGENRTFDNLFGAYKPTNGQHVDNLLSRGVILENGEPGPNFAAARQCFADEPGRTITCRRGPRAVTSPCRNPTRLTPLNRARRTAPFSASPRVPDGRFPRRLPNGPFQMTKYAPYGSYTGDPVHRFFQMWQDTDGGKHDKFVWVEETIGTGSNGDPAPSGGFNPKEGAISMGFYNMSRGDAPFFKSLAEKFAISDNYHQAVMGGTGANFQALVTGHAAYFTDWIKLDGSVATPPNNQIENPAPVAGTNNYYTQDGYSGGSTSTAPTTANQESARSRTSSRSRA